MIIDHSEANVGTCTLCGHKTSIPFLEWWSEGTRRDPTSNAPGHDGAIVLCARCCSRIAHGFIADLLAMKAKHDIEQLTGRNGLVVTVDTVRDRLGTRRAHERLERENWCLKGSNDAGATDTEGEQK